MGQPHDRSADAGGLPTDGAGAAPEVLDTRGLVCVQVFLRLRAHSRGAPAGAVVDVLTTDMASIIDMPAWCAITGAAEHLGHDEPRPGEWRHRIRLA